MGKLKNYVAIIKNIKKEKIKVMLNYFESENHSNHKNKTEIISVRDKTQRENFEKINSAKELMNRRNYEKNNRKGIEKSITNKSLTFNIPRNYECSIEEIKEINRKLIDIIVEEYALNGHEIVEEELYTNIHYQDNAHINFIIPTLDLFGKTFERKNQQGEKILDQNGKTQRFVNEKSFRSSLQKKFTQIVDNVLNTNVKDYKTQIEEIEEVEKVAKIEKFLTLEAIKREKEKHRDNKLLKRFYDYLYRLRSKEEELKQLEEDSKDLKRLQTTYKKIMQDNQATQQEIEELLETFERVGLDRKQLTQEEKSAIRLTR